METTLTPDLNPNQPVDANQLPDADRLLSAYQVAERLGISRALAYSLIQSGEIPMIRFRGTVRIQEADLEHFIQTHKIHPSK